MNFSQSDLVKDRIILLIDSGVRSKTEIFKQVQIDTGLPRPTIRRIAGELRKEINRKIRILTDDETLKRIKKHNVKHHIDFYAFIPNRVRKYWENKTSVDFVKVHCEVCKRTIGYAYKFSDERVVCGACKAKFPEPSQVNKKK